MRKLLVLVAVFVAMVMASCSKSATDYKKELTEMETQLEQIEEKQGKDS